MRPLSLSLLAAACLCAAAPAAQAADAPWLRWNAGVPADQLGAHVRVIKADVTAPGTAYAGTESDGIFKTTNNGVQWTPSSAGLTGGAKSIRAIFIDGGTVLAGTTDGLFSSSGAASWTPKGQGAGPDKLNLAVQAIHRSGSTLLAGVASGGVYKSTDGGNTWSKTTGMPVAETVWSLTGIGAIVYAGTTNGVYRSTNGGLDWTLSSDGLPWTAQVREVSIDANATGILYAVTTSDGIWRSITGGLTWSEANGEAGRQIEDEHGYSMTHLPAAGKPGVVLAGTDKGMQVSLDAGTTWGPMTKSGLASQLMRSSTLLPGSPVIYGGTQAAGIHVHPFQPPTPIDAPTISGTAAVGQKLTASVGNWGGTEPITYSYIWLSCPQDNSFSNCEELDPTSKDFYPTSNEQGEYIRVRVNARNMASLGAGINNTSNDTAAVAGVPGNVPVASPQALPTVDNSKSFEVGETITGTRGTWTGATGFVEQWQRCPENGPTDECFDIPGATGLSYVLQGSDKDRRVRLRVIASNANGTQTRASSTSLLVIAALPKNLLAPAIIGEPYIGETVQSNAGVWSGEGITYHRKWELCEADGLGCTPIGDSQTSTQPTYKIKEADRGKRLKLRITADNERCCIDPKAWSEPTLVLGDRPVAQPPVVGPPVVGPPVVAPLLKPASTKAPKLAGKARVGKVLTCSAGTWSGSPKLSFRWLRNGKAIKKATKKRYKVKRADRRKKLSCQVVAVNAAGKATRRSKAVKVR